MTYPTPCSAPTGATCVDYNECPAMEPPPIGIITIFIKITIAIIIIVIVITNNIIIVIVITSNITLFRLHPHTVGCVGCAVTVGADLSPEHQVTYKSLEICPQGK